MKKNNKNLATVIVTDIVGYSKLTGKNQDLALELLSEHDKIILESIDNHNGNVLVNRGDGFVVMFTDKSNAILCAMDIQIKIKARNKLNIKSRLFKIRIGIHTGEYSKDGGEYYGECIDIASLLEPLAPHGEILISSYLNSLIEFEDNIYSREYKKIDISKSYEMSYKIYLNLTDWYNDKKKNIHIIHQKKYLDKAHNLYKEGNYSGSIKFANSLFETSNNKKTNINILSFLCNSFIAIGQLDISQDIMKKIKSELSPNIKPELNGHLLKLEGHLLFNTEKWNKANKLYEKSYKILESIGSKYTNEVLFYLYLNLLFSNQFDTKGIYHSDKKLIEDEYKILIDCIKLSVTNSKNNNILIKKVNKLERLQIKSYAYWLLSKYYGNNIMVNESYEYETKAQETLKSSSYNISDKALRNKFMKNLILHRKILSETSVQIDDLVQLSDIIENSENNQSIIYTQNQIFNYCVNCGEENIDKNIECTYCQTKLLESFYN